jgi:excisionase family DNA binding protein
MLKTLLTPEEVADALQLHHLTVLKFIKAKQLKSVKLGRLYRIREEDLEEFLKQQTHI